MSIGPPTEPKVGIRAEVPVLSADTTASSNPDSTTVFEELAAEEAKSLAGFVSLNGFRSVNIKPVGVGTTTQTIAGAVWGVRLQRDGIGGVVAGVRRRLGTFTGTLDGGDGGGHILSDSSKYAGTVAFTADANHTAEATARGTTAMAAATGTTNRPGEIHCSDIGDYDGVQIVPWVGDATSANALLTAGT
jgi:hypothetical protein